MTTEFTPPGPGQWAIDRSHFTGGTTPIGQWLISEGAPAGFERVFAELGVPVEKIDMKFVNGFCYTRLRPLIGADKPPKKLPPLPILKLMTRLHPAFRAREKQARNTFRDRPSLEVVRRWDEEIRPELRAKNQGLQDTDIESLDDKGLEDHIGDLLGHLRRNIELHFWLHGHDIGPIALYLHRCVGWGIDPRAAIEALAGASPSTARPLETLRHLRSLADHGLLLVTGYDLTASTLIELPEVVLDSIRSVTAEQAVDHEAIAAELRDQVPETDRNEFDRVLTDARSVMDMRDDNGPLTAEWPLGLLRRALLEAGSRLHARNELVEADHALELTPEEARSLFSGACPTGEDLARRARQRAEMARLDPPVTLGDPEPEPPIDILPEALFDMVSMVNVAMSHMGMAGDVAEDQLAGVGVGSASYTGRARVADSATDAIDKLEPGDVLVVRATSPAFNAVLAMAGAVVTADGGALSHAAVIARELGIPGVIGASGALAIPDQSIVEVDPVTGRVRVVESGST
jgi:phosphohistidine swiveling domain-containing protein